MSDHARHVRRIERAIPSGRPTDRYVVVPGEPYHVLLPPRGRIRLYLSLPGAHCAYQPCSQTAIPRHPPATLIATWPTGDPHVFSKVAPEQVSTVAYYCNAPALCYVPPDVLSAGVAPRYEAAS